MHPVRRLALAATVALALPVPAAAAPDSSATFPAELDAWVAGVVRDWELPGAAIAVVVEGRLVTARGYGVREQGRPGRVDGNTIFDVASITKSFTAAAIGILVDEGRMAWDDPVRRHLPTLAFPDPYRTENVTVRDLLCHRVGLRPTNRAWYFTAVSRKDLLGLVRLMAEAAPFRTRFSYWNVGYAIAGEAAAAAAGASWEDLVTRRLLVPLGMKRSVVDFAAVSRMENVAVGHAWIDGAQVVIPRETNRQSTAPAGVLHASAADLARWMSFHLGDGTFEGRRILKEETLDEMHIAQFVQPARRAFRESRGLRWFPAYGLGWQVFDERGHPLLWHSGNGDGHLAYLALLPEKKLGVVVLVNSMKAGTALNGAIATRILRHYLGEPGKDETAELRARWERDQKAVVSADSARDAGRLAGAPPTRALSAYAGRYADDLGLDFEVWLDGPSLRLRYGGGEGARLEPWHHDVFRVRWENPYHDRILPTFVAFETDPAGLVSGLHSNFWGEQVDARRR